MIRHLPLTLLLILCPPSMGQNELNQAYFGMEFKDGREAVQISWIDTGNRTLKKLNVDDVILKAGDIPFKDAAELTAALKQRPAGESIRFEALAISDEKPRKVLVKPETLREAVPKRFQKERDRDAQQVLYAPKLKAKSFYIAIAQDFDGQLLGLRLRVYPNSPSLQENGVLAFRWPKQPYGNHEVKLLWAKDNLIYSGLTDSELEKLATLSDSQLKQVRAKAFLEFPVDQTDAITKVISETRRQRISVAGMKPYFSQVTTENEQRNFESALLYYRILKEAADAAK